MSIEKTTPRPKLSRRGFLEGTAASLAFSIVPSTVMVSKGYASPNNKLNIAGIGIGGMGGGNLRKCESENIVALCDVDDAYAAKTFGRYPQAKKYRDFRKMLEKEDKNIDAVVVATPDHTHAVIAMMAIEMGKHVFVQKPLAHTVKEVRALTNAARKHKVQTQMGNQGHSTDSIRELREWIKDGAIGPVREVHAWSDRPVGGRPWSDFPLMARPKDTPPVPKTLDWDLWLGPTAYRPYHPIYVPLQWRGWYAFGTGALGDMGCHILDPAFWALNLGQPTEVQATTTHYKPEISSETYPRASVVRYTFPARGSMPPVKVTWYDGRLKPPILDMWDPGRSLGTNGAILVGEKGLAFHGSHGAGGLRLAPKALHESYQRPAQTIQRVPDQSGGHEQDWIRACKDGKPASASFEYGGALTEMVLLGVLAMRVPDKKLLWDSASMRFTNSDKANELLHIDYRDGWNL
jgi:predicted dehydrogenase